MSHYKKLSEHYKKISNFSHLSAVSSWEQVTTNICLSYR